MDVDQLRVFVEVMRRGTFAAVARDRNVDPSSVSRVIASLEEHLRVRLFNRTTRQLSPTEAALAYFDRVEPMIDELERAAQAASDSGDTARGTLRVTAAVAFAQGNIVPLLPEFTRRYPEIAFELILTHRYVDLVEERIDLAVRIGRLAESSLVAHRLCETTNVICASPEYLRRRGRPRTPSDLEHHECLRYQTQGQTTRWLFRRGDSETAAVKVRGRVVATNGLALRECAVAGMGVLLLPRWNVADQLRSGELVNVFPDYETTASEFGTAAWMLYPSRAYLPRKVRVFADYLKSKFARGAPAEAGLAALTARGSARSL